MVTEIKYPCGCSYFHYGSNGVMGSHYCEKHRNEIIYDRLTEMMEDDD